VPDTAGVRVDYAGLRGSADWRRLLVSLSNAKPPGTSERAARLAFWINAYNVLAIQLVADHAPRKSIRDIGGFLRPVWKRKAGVVGGDAVTLDWIEHQMLRPMGEPRIHAAIVCASISCPSLLREPWRAEHLDRQFGAAWRAFLANPSKGLRVDAPANTLYLSKIFDWFAGDFADAGGVLEMIAPYLRPSDRDWLAANPEPRIRFLSYDWRLNDLASATAGAIAR
jgi:hypothetical protein